MVSCFQGFAQERKLVQGKVISKSRNLEDIYIENISARKKATSEKGGYFKIQMAVNDTLIFASVNLIAVKRIVKESDLSNKIFFVPMETSENVLDELVIDKRITSESLGFIIKKKYTPAEKRLYTATSSAGGIIAVDAIVNALSGRTAMLKKALDYEREQLIAKEMINVFDEDYYVNNLHIPKIYLDGFGYFLSQDPNILSVLKSKNYNLLKFMMTEKALEYLEIIKVLQ